jgi:hypothetical protein
MSTFSFVSGEKIANLGFRLLHPPLLPLHDKEMNSFSKPKWWIFTGCMTVGFILVAFVIILGLAIGLGVQKRNNSGGGINDAIPAGKKITPEGFFWGFQKKWNRNLNANFSHITRPHFALFHWK